MAKNRYIFLFLFFLPRLSFAENSYVSYESTTPNFNPAAEGTAKQCAYNLDSELVKTETAVLTQEHLDCNALITQTCAVGSAKALGDFINSNSEFKQTIGSCQYYDAAFIKDNCQKSKGNYLSPNNFTDSNDSLDRAYFNNYAPKPSVEQYNSAQTIQLPINALCADSLKTRIIVIQSEDDKTSLENSPEYSSNSKNNIEYESKNLHNDQLTRALVSLPSEVYNKATIKKYSFNEFRSSNLGKQIDASRLPRGMFILKPNENCNNLTADNVHFAAFDPPLPANSYSLKIKNDTTPITVNSVDRPSNLVSFINTTVPNLISSESSTGSINSKCFKSIPLSDGSVKEVAIFYPTSRFQASNASMPYHGQDYLDKCGPMQPMINGLIIPESEKNNTRKIYNPKDNHNIPKIIKDSTNTRNIQPIQPLEPLQPIREPIVIPTLLSPQKETLLNSKTQNATLRTSPTSTSTTTSTSTNTEKTNTERVVDFFKTIGKNMFKRKKD